MPLKASHCSLKSSSARNPKPLTHLNVNIDSWTHQDVSHLVNWYLKRKRDLPWRKDRDPYKIWISEIMLQQTTTTAVIPYFERFMKRFPTVMDLALASLESVYEQWTGLGYYSRARNIHKAAQVFAKEGFKKTYQELLAIPGIGPYASRAISSQAFGEKVGVVDGNVVRVFTRIFNFDQAWWNRATQIQIQNWSDHIASFLDPSNSNQALMELGATVCTPKSPTCLLCPWDYKCQSFKNQTQDLIPLKRQKRAKEIWIWQPEVYISKDKILMVQGLPDPKHPLFLQKKWVLPGRATQMKTKPKDFHYKHNITHHEIFVSVKKSKQRPNVSPKLQDQMVALSKVNEISPFSLVQKAIHHIIKS